MNISRGFFSIGAILLRARCGFGITGPIALAQAIIAIGLFGLTITFAKGAVKFANIAWLDVPVFWPLVVMTTLLLAVWIGRVVDRSSWFGPLWDNDAEGGHTGHPHRLWRSRWNVMNEWFALGRWEPMLLLAVGLTLLLPPFTRTVGLLLCCVAGSVAAQTRRDRYVNEGPQDAYYAQLLTSQGTAPTVDPMHQQVANLSDDLLELFEPEERIQMLQVREQLAIEAEQTPDESAADQTPIGRYTSRGPLSATPPIFLSASFYVIVSFFAINLVTYDPWDFLDRSKAVLLEGLGALDNEVKGLISQQSQHEPLGVLQGGFLERVAPEHHDVIRKEWDRDAVEVVLQAIRQEKRRLGEAVMAIETRLGFELETDDWPAGLNAALLDTPELFSTLADLKNTSQRISNDLMRAERTLSGVLESEDRIDHATLAELEQAVRTTPTAIQQLHNYADTLAAAAG